METDLLAYLQSKGLPYYRAAGNEVTTHCWWCADGDPKGKGRLYLNVSSWLYDCKRCGTSGNQWTLMEHFGDEEQIRQQGQTDLRMRQQLMEEAVSLAHEMLCANEKKLQYLLDRGISAELISAMKLGYVPPNVGFSEMLPSREKVSGYHELIAAGLVTVQGKEFFNDCIVIPYFSHGSVIQIRAKFIDGKYLTVGGENVRLYHSDSLVGKDRVLVTEGELDALAVLSQIEQSGERSFDDLAVVAIPGAHSWPDHMIEMLLEKRKVFIGLDPDDVGKKAAEKMKAELGNKGRIIDLPEGEPKCDWTDFFLPKSAKNWGGGHSWTDLRDLMVRADLAGKQLFTIADMAAKWSQQLVAAPGLKLGWPSLDSHIRPGLRPGQIFIPLAKSGTGKTVFLSNIAHNLRKHRVLYVSLEMTAAEVHEHMRRIHRFWYPQAEPDQILTDYSLLRTVEQNRIKPGDLGDYVKEYADDVGEKPELIIVDYLQYFARGFAGGKPYERASDAIMETKAVGKEEGCAFVIPSQVNRGAEHGKPIGTDDARDSGVVEETGDFLTSLFRPDQLIDKATNKTGEMLTQSGDFNSQILKSRHGGKGRIAKLRLSLLSLAITDTVFDRGNTLRVDQENALYRQGMNYEDYRKHLNAVNGQEAMV